MLGLEMADHGFDGYPAAQLAFDLACDTAFLAGYEDPELVSGGTLWPRYLLSASWRAMMLPMSASMCGITAANV